MTDAAVAGGGWLEPAGELVGESAEESARESASPNVFQLTRIVPLVASPKCGGAASVTSKRTAVSDGLGNMFGE